MLQRGSDWGHFLIEIKNLFYLLGLSAFALQKEAQNKQTGNRLLINYVIKLKAI